MLYLAVGQTADREGGLPRHLFVGEERCPAPVSLPSVGRRTLSQAIGARDVSGTHPPFTLLCLKLKRKGGMAAVRQHTLGVREAA